MQNHIGCLCVGLLSVAATLSPALSATIVEYELADLGPVTATQELWEYRYYVSGFTFNANQGFTIWFDENTTAEIETPAPPNSQWDVLVLQPDLALPDHGAFDALALVSGASLAQPFAVNFVSLGGTPGSQQFNINEFDSLGNLVGVLESGTTVPRETGTVPEPGTFWLIGCAGVWFALRKRAVSHRPI